jgi:hypothetical protein
VAYFTDQGGKRELARDNEALVGLGRFGPPPTLYSSIIPFVEMQSQRIRISDQVYIAKQ